MAFSETAPRTLADSLRESQLPWAEALSQAVALAQELCRVHTAGRIHGALSPAAIVLTGSGIELLSSSDSNAEALPYTAPEVLAGAPGDVLSDVFSFGAIVYEMLSGRRPFEGDTPQTLARCMAGSPPRPCCTTAVASLIQTCIAKEPAARFQRMEKILLELKLAAIAGRLRGRPAATRCDPVSASLESELRDAQRSLLQQAAAIESLRAEVKRNEGLLSWVVDILETMQTNALEQPPNAALADAASSWPEAAGTRRDSAAAEAPRTHLPADESVAA